MPEDHNAAGSAGYGRLRASHADREQVIEILKTAFVQGRLTRDEFGTRVGQTVMSQTYAELNEVTADLPPGLWEERPPLRPAWTWPKVPATAAISTAAFTMLASLAGLLAAILSRSLILVVSATVMIALVGSLTFVGLMVAAWRDRGT